MKVGSASQGLAEPEVGWVGRTEFPKCVMKISCAPPRFLLTQSAQAGRLRQRQTETGPIFSSATV